MPRKQAFPRVQSNKVFGHPLRVGLYARVSTHDQQTLPLQIRALRDYAAKRGWTIVAQIKEVGSGASQRELRQALLAAARRREIDVVLVWRLDRWGRSVADLVSTLQELQHLSVGFVSLTEALDLTTPAGRPKRFPFSRAWARPARTRSRRISRSNSANTAKQTRHRARKRRRSMPARCGSYIAPVSARPRSLAGCRSGGPQYAGFWLDHFPEK